MHDGDCPRHTFRGIVPDGLSRVRALHTAYCSGHTYSFLTEVEGMKVVVVKAPKTLAPMLKKMFGIK